MTDPEQAALAALVAWRKVDERYLKTTIYPFSTEPKYLRGAKDRLRAKADRLIAERAAAVGR